MGEGKGWRDFIINRTNLVDILLKLTSETKINRTLLKTISWLNSNIQRHKGLSQDIVIIWLTHYFNR